MAETPTGGDNVVIIRKLGINETYQQAMYLLNQYRGTVLSCRYKIPPRLVPGASRARLQQAFKVAVVDTILRHPMLQVGMTDAYSKTPSWIQLPSLDLKQHVEWHYLGQDDDLEQRIQDTLRVQLDEFFPDFSLRQPQWKMTIIRKGDAPVMEVLLTWNHAHFDGLGARVIHEDLLDMLNQAGTRASKRPGLDGDIFMLPTALPMLPEPLENLRSLPVDPSLATWCPIRLNPYGTQYRSFFVDNPFLLKLIALCRKNQTTITGLLHRLALIAYSSHLDSKQAPAFQASTIVDHRPSVHPAPADAPWGHSVRAVSNYVTQCLHTVDMQSVARVRSTLQVSATEGRDMSADTQRELWIAAAKARLDLVRKLEDPLRNDIVGLFKWVTDWQKTMSDLVKRTRQFSWLLTNLSVLNGDSSARATGATRASTAGGNKQSDDGQQWYIERAEFGLSAEMHAAVIEIAPVSVAGHGMCVGFIWPDCAVDREFAERVVTDFERWLAQLANLA